MGLFDRLRSMAKRSGSPSASEPTASHFAWLEARIAELATLDVDSPSTRRRSRELLDAYGAMLGKSATYVFGMAPDALRLDTNERDRIAADLRAAIFDVRAKYERGEDVVALYELAACAERLELPELRLTRRYPLRCDPLGSVEGLSPAWARRIATVTRVRDAKLALDWGAVGVTPRTDDDEPAEVELGAPDLEALYSFALRYEAELHEPFSRELAAFFSVANGICIDGFWSFLARVSDWTYEDEGLRVGSGSFAQGSLCLEPDGGITALSEANVIMRDDQGEIVSTFEDFGALVDRLLPS